MDTGQTGWLLLLVAALALILIGVQGSLGTLVAILFSPNHVDLQE